MCTCILCPCDCQNRLLCHKNSLSNGYPVSAIGCSTWPLQQEQLVDINIACLSQNFEFIVLSTRVIVGYNSDKTDQHLSHLFSTARCTLIDKQSIFLYWTDKIKISNYEISQFLIFSAVLLAMLFVVIVNNLQTCVKKVYWFRSSLKEHKSRFRGWKSLPVLLQSHHLCVVYYHS